MESLRYMSSSGISGSRGRWSIPIPSMTTLLHWFTALLAVGAPFYSHWIKSLCTVWSLRGQKQFHLWIWGKPGRHSELQASWGYIMRPCLQKKDRKKEKKKFCTTKLTDTYRIEKKCQLCFRQEFTHTHTYIPHLKIKSQKIRLPWTIQGSPK